MWFVADLIAWFIRKVRLRETNWLTANFFSKVSTDSSLTRSLARRRECENAALISETATDVRQWPLTKNNHQLAKATPRTANSK